MPETPSPYVLRINGVDREVAPDPRTTVLDALREQLQLTGTKKGCDHGQCGACTVHVDGEPRLACLTLAVMADGRDIRTIEGLGAEDALHPVQAAFVEHDAFQCGYCTSGQIMSAVACVRQGRTSSAGEIQEFMSGNLCRCAAYPNIVAAIEQVAGEQVASATMAGEQQAGKQPAGEQQAGKQPAGEHGTARRTSAPVGPTGLEPMTSTV